MVLGVTHNLSAADSAQLLECGPLDPMINMHDSCVMGLSAMRDAMHHQRQDNQALENSRDGMFQSDAINGVLDKGLLCKKEYLDQFLT